MQTRIFFALVSLQLLSACNKKKFDSDVPTRPTSTTSPPVEEAPAIPVQEVSATSVQEESIIPIVKAPDAVAPVEPAPTIVLIPNVSDVKSETPKPVPVDDKSIEFGASEIFRIGDGFASSGSACVGQVNSYKLSGTKYYFQFEVADDNTQIDLSIGRICGVDQIDKDTFSLINEGTKMLELAEKPLLKSVEFGPEKPWIPYPAFTLKKGLYSVVIHSKNILGKVVAPGTPLDPSKDEHDDFLVGNIKLKASKKVTARKIYVD